MAVRWLQSTRHGWIIAAHLLKVRGRWKLRPLDVDAIAGDTLHVLLPGNDMPASRRKVAMHIAPFSG